MGSDAQLISPGIAHSSSASYEHFDDDLYNNRSDLPTIRCDQSSLLDTCKFDYKSHPTVSEMT